MAGLEDVPGFITAAQAGYNFGRGLRRDQALADLEANPPTNPNTYTYQTPSDVGPPQPGLEDLQGASQPVAGIPQPATPEQMAQRRASIMRQYGDTEGADKTLQSNAQLGLTNAQTAETTQRTTNLATDDEEKQLGLSQKRRENDRTLQQQQITKQVTGKLQSLTDAQGNPRAPTSDEMIANQQELAAQLYSGGFTSAAQDVIGQIKSGIKDRIEADAAQRQDAANQLYMQVKAGNFSGVPAFAKRFSYGPGGASIDAIQPGPQPGTLTLVFSDNQGQKTKVVSAAGLQAQILDQLKLQASGNAAVFEQTARHIDAQIAQERAAANASNASANRSNAETKLINARGDREQTLEDARSAAADALDKDPSEQTPADQAAIKKWTTLATLERARSGAGASGGNDGARTMNGKIGGRDVTIRTHADGTSEYLDQVSPTDRTTIWKPIGKAQAAAAVQAAGGAAAGAPANAASRPPLDAFNRR